MNLDRSVKFLFDRIPEKPICTIILGSGLGQITDKLEDRITIPYKKLPYYPCSSVIGHKGEWVFGYINEKPILCASGRFHYYEKFSIEEIVSPVFITDQLQCKNIIITNSSGCLNKHWNLGDFMFIEGYLDYTFQNNNLDKDIVSFSNVSKYYEKLNMYAKNIGIDLRKGVYTWTLGPNYETSAEIQDIIKLGGNAVGMSSVPEMMKAYNLGLTTIGISCLTNYGAGLQHEILTHDSVLDISQKAKHQFYNLIEIIIQYIM